MDGWTDGRMDGSGFPGPPLFALAPLLSQCQTDCTSSLPSLQAAPACLRNTGNAEFPRVCPLCPFLGGGGGGVPQTLSGQRNRVFPCSRLVNI